MTSYQKPLEKEMALLKRPFFKFILLLNLTFAYSVIYGMPANLSSQAQQQHLPAGFSLANLTSFCYILFPAAIFTFQNR